MAWVARKTNIVPVDPGCNLVKAMRAGAYGLRHDKVLILFPEGERSIDGSVKTFKKGAAILSLHLGAPIMPIAMDGVFDVWPRNRPPRWRALLPGGDARVLMEMGASFDPESTAAAEEQFVAATDRLRDTVERMWHGLRERRARSG